jgi:hypothetical protein
MEQFGIDAQPQGKLLLHRTRKIGRPDRTRRPQCYP